jgi:hypothetical protein
VSVRSSNRKFILMKGFLLSCILPSVFFSPIFLFPDDFMKEAGSISYKIDALGREISLSIIAGIIWCFICGLPLLIAAMLRAMNNWRLVNLSWAVIGGALFGPILGMWVWGTLELIFSGNFILFDSTTGARILLASSITGALHAFCLYSFVTTAVEHKNAH